MAAGEKPPRNPQPSSFGSAKLGIVALAAVVVTILATQAVRVPREGCGDPSPEVRNGETEAERLGAKDAYARGIELFRLGRSPEALPYLRRALELRPDLWQVQSDYATALFNSAYATRGPSRLRQPLVRSSWERVTLMKTGLHHLQMAIELTTSPREEAYVRVQRAQAYGAWGLAHDALDELERARQADSTWHEVNIRILRLREEQKMGELLPDSEMR